MSRVFKQIAGFLCNPPERENQQTLPLSDNPQSELIWQLASISCPWWINPEEVLMVPLTAAFDASGTENTSVLTVAGFVSSEKDWRDFSKAWSERLAQDGIKFFRAVDAAFFNGPFEHWKEREDKEQLRIALFGDLMKILKAHVYHRFGCAIINKSSDKTSAEVRDKFKLESFTLAALSCEKQFRHYLLTEWKNSNPQMPVRMVFEHGDEGFGDVAWWTKSSKGTVPVSTEYKNDTTQSDGLVRYGFVPLQAADWLAYEIGLSIRQINQGRIKTQSNFRWPMREFNKILGNATTFILTDMDDAKEKIEIVNNDPNWQTRSAAEISDNLKQP